MPILEKAKAALRIKNAAFDGEIEGLIAACEADMRLVGINVPPPPAPPPTGDAGATGDAVTGNPLIERAIMLYCKANFGYSEDSEKYQKAYDYLKCALSLAGGYH